MTINEISYNSPVQTLTKLKTLSEDYFKAFAAKDLNKLSSMFTDDVILFDPIIKEVKSKAKVLEANQQIFSGVNNIKFVYQRIFVDQNSNTSIGELKIDFDGKIIEVVDIIEFTNEGKIAKITAYLDSKQVA